ncbi:MAG: response regulator [Cyanobacteriota bacterium]
MSKQALVVEDKEINRLTISTFLKVSGFQVDVAGDGIEGLNQLQQKEYDLIFSDIEMPNMNGFEFLKKVKQNDKYKKIPVVMLTTLNDEVSISKTKALGASYHMIKPFSLEKMKIALNSSGF